MSGADEFVARISELQRRVGRGTLRGSLVRDRPQAQIQHEDASLRHPDGGSWKYQEGPLYAGAARYLQRVADTVLSPEGPAAGMQDAMEALNRDSAAVTPRDTGDLAGSGHVRVISDGEVVRDVPPASGPRRPDTPAQQRARRPR